MSELWIRATYGVLLAIAVAFTVVSGITAVLAEPRPPDTPSLTFAQLQSVGDNQQDTDRVVGVVDRFYQDTYDFRRAFPTFQRNLLVAAVISAMVVGAIGIAIGPSFNYLRFGLTLSAVLLLLYAATITLSPAPNPAPGTGSLTALLAAGVPPGLDFAGRFLRFAASLIALLVFLFLGLWRLTDWSRLEMAPSPTTAVGPAVTAQPPAGSTPEGVAWSRPDSE
jgi:hypothetical protein